MLQFLQNSSVLCSVRRRKQSISGLYGTVPAQLCSIELILKTGKFLFYNKSTSQHLLNCLEKLIEETILRFENFSVFFLKESKD